MNPPKEEQISPDELSNSKDEEVMDSQEEPNSDV